MSVAFTIKLEDGTKFVILAHSVYPLLKDEPLQEDDLPEGQICVPVNQIEGMTNEQLGSSIRKSIKFTHLAVALNTVDYDSWHFDKLSLMQVYDRIDYYESFSEFDNPEIEKILEELYVKRNELENIVPKKKAKKRRKEFNKNRDSLMLKVIKRDGYQCAICETSNDLAVDHIKPLSKGGGDDLENLQILCRHCNSRKGAKE